MKIVTFNIRCDFGQDGANNFEFRKPLILVGCGRTADYQDEAMTIAVRNETSELLGLEVFWLSPTPYVPGSRYENQSECPRTCAMAIIKNQDFPGPIRVYNTHLDHIGAQARMKGLSQILRQMEDDSDKLALPSVLMGDFNAYPDSVELTPINDFVSLGLKDITAQIPLTYHNYHLGQEETGKIDYIYITEPFQVKDVRRWEDEENGVYLSDHYPICAELTL